MLKKVDPTNPILVAYMQTINPSIEMGVLLRKSTATTSKKRKESKKQAKESPSTLEQVENVVKVTSIKVVKSAQPSKEIHKLIVDESFSPMSEVMPSKSGILKLLKKMAHWPRHSSDRSSSFSPKVGLQITRKFQINRKGVVIREIPTPVSLVSKKQRAGDMAKKLVKRKNKVVIENEDEVIAASPIHDHYTIVSSPKKVVIENEDEVVAASPIHDHDTIVSSPK
ncbi:unnamed protein product [Lactuca saligna]|uniref:Uncharacterized protein n=1 Tax=Lactuca saligna TaxID=75948 RepID=A0AA35ZDA3_LACSI|nr:unnamed protein product [Lactuca saligna]